MLSVFILRLAGQVKTLGCPPLPLRCSDRNEYGELTKGIESKKNIIFTLSSRLYWAGVGSRQLDLVLFSDEESPFFPRGVYRIEEHCLKIRDWCGFFEYRIFTGKDDLLTVYPASLFLKKGIPARRNDVPEKRAFRSWQKDREFFEARPYYPGDDPRRINWKMLARHDELFIKEGNSLSPSKKSALLLLSGSSDSDAVDLLFRRLSALIDLLSEAGLQLTAVLPDGGSISGIEELTAREKEDLLASVHPAAAADFSLIRKESYGIIYFFCTLRPEESVLNFLNASFPYSRKIMILSSLNSVESANKVRGWKVVQA